MNAAYIMADTKMDIDPSGDTHRTGSSAFAPDPFLPGQIPSKCRKKRTEGIREIRASGEVSWLLHIISARAFWEEGKIQTKICVFGVPLSRLNKKLSGKKKKTKN